MGGSTAEMACPSILVVLTRFVYSTVEIHTIDGLYSDSSVAHIETSEKAGD